MFQLKQCNLQPVLFFAGINFPNFCWTENSKPCYMFYSKWGSISEVLSFAYICEYSKKQTHENLLNFLQIYDEEVLSCTNRQVENSFSHNQSAQLDNCLS